MKDELIKQLFEEMLIANATALALLIAAGARQMEAGPLMVLIAIVKSSLAATKKVHPNSRSADLAIYIATESLAALEAEILLRQQEQQTGKTH